MKLKFPVPYKGTRWSCEFADGQLTGPVRFACEHCDFKQVVPWEIWYGSMVVGQADFFVGSRCEDKHEPLLVELVAGRLT